MPPKQYKETAKRLKMAAENAYRNSSKRSKKTDGRYNKKTCSKCGDK